MAVSRLHHIIYGEKLVTFQLSIIREMNSVHFISQLLEHDVI